MTAFVQSSHPDPHRPYVPVAAPVVGRVAAQPQLLGVGYLSAGLDWPWGWLLVECRVAGNLFQGCILLREKD